MVTTRSPLGRSSVEYLYGKIFAAGEAANGIMSPESRSVVSKVFILQFLPCCLIGIISDESWNRQVRRISNDIEPAGKLFGHHSPRRQGDALESSDETRPGRSYRRDSRAPDHVREEKQATNE